MTDADHSMRFAVPFPYSDRQFARNLPTVRALSLFAAADDSAFELYLGEFVATPEGRDALDDMLQSGERVRRLFAQIVAMIDGVTARISASPTMDGMRH